VSDNIALTGISATGYHGVFPDERRDGQVFIVDLKLFLDLALAGKHDDLKLTVNYASVAETAVAEITGEPLDLIEALAERISKRVLEEFSLVNQVEVTVHKPNAPVAVNFTDISATIVRSR